jgi:hypothetical protein
MERRWSLGDYTIMKPLNLRSNRAIVGTSKWFLCICPNKKRETIGESRL